jgi:uncharacterized ferritin-like protein (DUF455 family)
VTTTLSAAGHRILTTPDANDKAKRSRDAADAWRRGRICGIGSPRPVLRPARPLRPELRAPRDMPRRRKGRSKDGRVALLHALAHIELNAIDLAWDIVTRFAGDDLPLAFFADWVGVGDDEARHFLLLQSRLADFGSNYGDLPAHDGLWEAAASTCDDLMARLAVVPMVLEARGLDVTPTMIGHLRDAGDSETAAILATIYRDEIGHVAAGHRWFEFLCRKRHLDPVATWQGLVRTHFPGRLKPPFNGTARETAGLTPDYYEPLAASSADW